MLTTATLDTVHEGKFNDNYAWMQVCHIHTNILVPTCIIHTEVTYNKVA